MPIHPSPKHVEGCERDVHASECNCWRDADIVIGNPRAATRACDRCGVCHRRDHGSGWQGHYFEPCPGHPADASDVIVIENPRPAGLPFCGGCGHLRAVHYRDGSEQGGGCDGFAVGDAPARCRCGGYIPEPSAGELAASRYARDEASHPEPIRKEG